MGGGSCGIFRDLQNPMRFSRGGGVVAEFLFFVTGKGHFPLMDPFFVFYFPEGGGPGRRIFLFRDLKTAFSVNGALFSVSTFPGPPPLNRPLDFNLRISL